jgi:proton-translocating NADH-quinone oxidoreductase chain L
MFDMTNWLWLIPFLPFAGCALIALFGKAFLRQQSHWPCILGAAGACVLSIITLLNVHGHEHPLILDQYVWFAAGDVQVGFSMRADGLSAVMLVTVTFIGSLIAIYASGYMHGDPGYPRFFAAVSLFLAAMTTLVLANNFILLYAGWEGVGVCSYLLIGFWFAKPSAAAAARKAFLVTRLGDIGLFLGILLLWSKCGYSLEYGDVFARAPQLDSWTLTVACLLLFTGAVGKSAQFPLHVWLPDAMEGPSPVSALIHAATMVTAGVYLVARCTPLFGHSPEAQIVVAVIGGFTSLLAALIALTQTDLKRVLAYSTVSQLGYMFLALGSGIASGNDKLAAFAVTAAIFHLVTHAFFKALLFLGAGSVMHAMGDVIDMRRFSGLHRVLPTTHWTFLIGSLALAGFPPLAGFWSKDEILAVCFEASEASRRFATVYLVLFFAALITAGLTAFYTFRGYFMTFWGELRIPDEAYLHHGHGGHDDHGHHDHNHAHAIQTKHPHAVQTKPAEVHRDPNKKFESGPAMTIPLMILAVGSAFIGLILGANGMLAHFFEEHWMRLAPGDGGFPNLLPTPLVHKHYLLLMGGSTLFAVGGIALAYFVYVKHPAKATDMANSMKGLYGFSRNKFYLDELFGFLFVKPLEKAAQFSRLVDTYIVDGLVDLFGQLPASLGQALKPLQNGLVQFYALLMALGVAGFMLAVLLR